MDELCENKFNTSDQAAREHIFSYVNAHAKGPFSVTLELTRRCNLSCPHCYQPEHTAGNELSLEEIDALLSSLAQSGTLFLTLTGGEAAMSPHFWQTIEAAASRRFVVRLKTNGVAFSGSDALRLHQAGVSEIHVSLYHHNPERHDAFVGKPGSFQKALNTMRVFKADGGRVRAMTMLMDWNLDAALSLQSLYDEEGFDHAFDFRIEPLENGVLTPTQYQVADQAMAKLMPKIDTLRRQLNLRQKDIEPAAMVCGIGKSNLYIGANGDVFPCGVSEAQKLGSIRTQSLESIWFGEKRRSLFNITWEKSEKCLSCEKSDVCFRCPFSASVEHGDATQPATLDCRMANIRHLAAKIHHDSQSD